MLTTRIRPKDRVKPLASRNSSAASDRPLIACSTALLIKAFCASALVRAALEEFLGLVGPELRYRGIGLHRHVGQHIAEHRVLDLLDARYVHILDRVVVGVELERPARRLDLH